MIRSFSFSAVLAISMSAASLAQQDFSKVEVKTTHVAGPIYMLEGAGGNIGLSLGEDGVLLIDDQYAPLSEKIQAAITKLGGGKPEFVLNTHWHGDHVGGNEHFGGHAAIIALTNVRTRLAHDQTLFGKTVEALSRSALPVITFDDRLSIHFNGDHIQAIHYPSGHTDGDVVVFFSKSNVVHMGDLFFAGQFPFVDLEHGGDVQGLIRNVNVLLRRMTDDTRIIPGHGPLSTRRDLEAYHLMLERTSEYVRAMIGDGKTLEQIKRNGLPTRWEEWGKGFIKVDRWIETLYQSLQRKKAR